MATFEMETMSGTKTTEIKGHLLEKLDGADHDRGALEEAQGTADNVKIALANLVDLLVERGVLTGDDIDKITNDVW